MNKRIRITSKEADTLRFLIAQAKDRLGARQSAIVAFAKMFGKFLPEYRICVGGI